MNLCSLKTVFFLIVIFFLNCCTCKKAAAVPLKEANGRFKECCKAAKVTKECMDYCAYDMKFKDIKNVFIKKLFTNMLGINDLLNPATVDQTPKDQNGKDVFLLDGPCGYSSLEKILKCANGGNKGSDNRKCCQRAGVYKESDSNCARFCQKDPYIGETSKDDMPCIYKTWRKTVFSKIFQCHYEGLKP